MEQRTYRNVLTEKTPNQAAAVCQVNFNIKSPAEKHEKTLLFESSIASIDTDSTVSETKSAKKTSRKEEYAVSEDLTDGRTSINQDRRLVAETPSQIKLSPRSFVVSHETSGGINKYYVSIDDGWGSTFNAEIPNQRKIAVAAKMPSQRKSTPQPIVLSDESSCSGINTFNKKLRSAMPVKTPSQTQSSPKPVIVSHQKTDGINKKCSGSGITAKKQISKKRRMIFLREILNTKTMKKRIELSTSNWPPAGTVVKRNRKKSQVDAATLTEPVSDDHVMLQHLLENLNATPVETKAYPNTFSVNYESTTCFSEIQNEIMNILEENSIMAPGNVATPVSEVNELLSEGEYATLANLNENLFSLPDLSMF